MKRRSFLARVLGVAAAAPAAAVLPKVVEAAPKAKELPPLYTVDFDEVSCVATILRYDELPIYRGSYIIKKK